MYAFPSMRPVLRLFALVLRQESRPRVKNFLGPLSGAKGSARSAGQST